MDSKFLRKKIQIVFLFLFISSEGQRFCLCSGNYKSINLKFHSHTLYAFACNPIEMTARWKCVRTHQNEWKWNFFFAVFFFNLRFLSFKRESHFMPLIMFCTNIFRVNSFQFITTIGKKQIYTQSLTCCSFWWTASEFMRYIWNMALCVVRVEWLTSDNGHANMVIV